MGKYTKFIVAVLGAVATVIQQVWPTSQWAVAVTAAVTAALVYLAPNKTKP